MKKSGRLLAAVGCLLSAVMVSSGAAEATGGRGPAISVSGALTQPTVAQAVHAIPVDITDSGRITDIVMSYDGVVVKHLTFPDTPTRYVGDLGPYDASPAGGFQPGPHTVKILATNDVEGSTSIKTLSFNISGPNVSASGALRSHAGGSVTPGSYDATVSATPSVAGGQGIARLELRVDGALVDAATQSCSGGCGSLSNTFWFNTEPLESGSHTVEALAVDAAGEQGKTTWSVTADPTRTLFVFQPSVPVEDVDNAVSAASARWIEFHHTGVAEGGYLLGNESTANALDDYREDYGDEEGIGSLPQVSEVTVGGNVPASALGSLSDEVIDRHVIAPDGLSRDLTEEGDEAGVLYPDGLMADDEYAESQPSDPRESDGASRSSLAAATATAKPFAPSYGQVNTYNWPGSKRPRRIAHTLTFPREAVGDVDGDGDKDESPFERSGPPDHGYEHDMKLFDDDFSGSRKHPLCTDEKERFWAQRKGYTWTTKFPSAAHPYFDDNAGDGCAYLDFTIGVEYPLELRPGVKYSIRIRTRAGDRQTSRYYVNAQKTFRACTGDPKYCSESAGGGAEGQLLVGLGSGARTQECRRWRKGYNSRRTCDFLEG